MPEPSSGNGPEKTDLFSDEEGHFFGKMPGSGIQTNENDDPLIIKKSKKAEIKTSADGHEEVRIYRGKGANNEDLNSSYGKSIESHDSNAIDGHLDDALDFGLATEFTESEGLPIGLVLEPLYQKEKYSFKIKAMSFIALILFTIIIFLLWSSKNNKDGSSGADSSVSVNNPARGLIQPLVPLEDESLAGTKSRVKDSIEKFFRATEKEELYGIIRRNMNVSDQLVDYYSRNEFSFPKLKSVDSVLRFEDPPNFWIANITVQDEVSARSVILEDSDKGFLVDWEEFVRYSSMDWADFIDVKSQEAIDFRVRATLDVNPGFAFPEREKWVCVRIDDWKSDAVLFGYVIAGTELSERIQKFLYDEWQKDCILRLQFPEDPRGGINQVRILDLINDSWVRFD